MDTMEPAFEDLIVEQAQRHLDKLPTFEGIAIDRLDYSEFYNYDADDGVSWVPHASSGNGANVWGPARAVRVSYRHTFNRLHKVFHPEGGGGKMMLINCTYRMCSTLAPQKRKARESKTRVTCLIALCTCVGPCGLVGVLSLVAVLADWGSLSAFPPIVTSSGNSLCRIDEFRSFDGSFSEGGSLNSVAFTGLRQPSILWTYSLEPDEGVLNDYFQQHLLMNVYPMAP